MLLTTACATPTAAEEIDFLPLRVDYQEKFSASGKTLGGYIKREGRPTQREILICRLIDRPIRPLFEEGFHNEVQLLSYVYSYDGVHAPEPLAICGASAALVLSDIPFKKPVGAVRVGLVADRFVVNPTMEEQKSSRLDLLLAGTEDAILMIEGFCDFLTEEQILEAIDEGHLAIRNICQSLQDWQREIGKPKMAVQLRLPSQELHAKVQELTAERIKDALKIKEKKLRDEAVSAVSQQLLTALVSDAQPTGYSKGAILSAFKEVQSQLMRRMILEENRRSDGRGCEEIRPIHVETSLLPRTHGSALFTRGETQALAVATLGGENMSLRSEDLDGEQSTRFYLQYFFPPFSVGEVGRMGAPGRREIGHGKLAERALAAISPSIEHFPYVIRLESNITESNGSSSMASVCGGCLAMMDAGIPIKRPIAGIAMGLILEGQKFAILSDILGAEDALGDMDFKVTGDAQGITAFQLDLKIEGITRQIMQVALAQAKQGRIHILNKMIEACPKPKEHLSTYAPHITTMTVKPSKIGTIIGPAGKQIRAITEETGADVDIDDSGLVCITGTSKESMERARRIIEDLTSEAEIGKTYTGRVVSIVPFGIFVEILAGKEGLCHISELSHARVQNIQDIVNEGDVIEVQVIDINERGQIRLSRKVLLPQPEASPAYATTAPRTPITPPPIIPPRR